MNGVSFAVGAARISKRLQAVAKAISPSVEEAMAREAESATAEMRKLVPVRTGDLRDSTDWTFGDAPQDAKFAVVAHRARVVGSFISLTIFSGSFRAFYARWVEFGTKARAPGKYRAGGGLHAAKAGKLHDAGAHGHRATKAHPYFWPVWRAHLPLIKKALLGAMQKALKAGFH